MKQYQFKETSSFKKYNAQEIGSYLFTRFSDEERVPKNIVEDAKKKSSPLNKVFEWDDSVAGRRFRLWQARALIGAIFIKIDTSQDPVRAFETVIIENHKCYASNESITHSKDLYTQVLDQAKREILYWESKYSSLNNQLPKIFSAIKELKEEQASGKEEGDRSSRGRAKDNRSANRNARSNDKAKRGHTASR